MPGQISTLPIDFLLSSLPTDDELQRLVIQPIKDLTKTDFDEVSTQASSSGRRTICLEAKPGQPADIFVLIRVYDRVQPEEKVLMSVTVELPADAEDVISKYSNMDLEDTLKAALENNFKNSQANFYPCLKRCIKDTPYMRTSDDRLIEYGFQEVLFSQQTDYQHVQIVQTVDFGRLLNLDRMTNLAESDTEAYTHAVMNLPHENYKDKTVLILGGGDGALMKELLELPADQTPSFVTMVDIDDVVMTACSKYMRSVCGEYMDKDKRESSRHKIIAGDAIKFLKECLATGRKFDYVFGDLTDTPVSTTSRDADIWAFLRSILDMGVRVCKPESGRYLTHCNGKCVPEAHEAYEKMLRTLAGGKCTFTRSERFVPSFMETWMYYQITRHE